MSLVYSIILLSFMLGTGFGGITASNTIDRQERQVCTKSTNTIDIILHQEGDKIWITKK